ncbi:hypothetical protein MBLNU459_g6650t1 [Dothideomycetes sp. NU459]
MSLEDEAIAAFDFGLEPPKQATPPSQSSESKIVTASQSNQSKIAPLDQSSGKKIAMSSQSTKPAIDKALPALPPTPTYSLFPKIPPAMAPIGLQEYKDGVSPPLGHPYDHGRPRKASLPSSVRTRVGSNASSLKQLPSATITTPNAGKYPRRPLPVRVGIQSHAASPPLEQHTSVSATSSRWSGDTTTPTLSSPIGSSSVKTRDSVSSSSHWPATGSFFEESDDEEVPLRRKVAGKFARCSGSSAGTMIGRQTPSSQTWFQRWMLCGACRGCGGQQPGA